MKKPKTKKRRQLYTSGKEQGLKYLSMLEFESPIAVVCLGLYCTDTRHNLGLWYVLKHIEMNLYGVYS